MLIKHCIILHFPASAETFDWEIFNNNPMLNSNTILMLIIITIIDIYPTTNGIQPTYCVTCSNIIYNIDFAVRKLLTRMRRSRAHEALTV